VRGQGQVLMFMKLIISAEVEPMPYDYMSICVIFILMEFRDAPARALHGNPILWRPVPEVVELSSVSFHETPWSPI